MDQRISGIIDRIRALEEELEVEASRVRAELHFTIENRKIRFEQAILERHKQLKIGLARYLVESRPLNVLTAPIIYGMGAPLLLLDLGISIYQFLCFPAYGIAKVRRADHFVYDRQLLPYLNLIEKWNCLYCSYGNGLISYSREIVARTEQYWCPIKHARRILSAHSRYSRFVDFGDGEGYHQNLEKLREELHHPDRRNKRNTD